MDDPLEELTELVWPSSELPALEMHLWVDEVSRLERACLRGSDLVQNYSAILSRSEVADEMVWNDAP